MADTVCFYDGTIAGQIIPPQHTASEDAPYFLRNIVDLSKRELDAGDSDVGQCLYIPAGTTVLDCFIRVITAETANGTLDLGYGSDVDRWGNGLPLDATGCVDTIRVGSATWDAGSIADGDEEAKDVTVDGAVLGDIVTAVMGIDVADLVVAAHVTAANTVTVSLANNTGGAVDLGSTTVTCLVDKAPLRAQPLYFAAADTIDVVATTDVADVDLDGAKFEIVAKCIKSLNAY